MNKSLRFYAGVVFFVLAWTLPLFGLLVAKLNLSLAAKATIIGLLTVGGPELLGLLAVLCLRKETLISLKNMLLTWLKRLKPAAPVSRTRYRVGLIMFLLPIIPTYIMAYIHRWLPEHSPQHLSLNPSAEFLCPVILFVLRVIFGINCGLFSCMMPGWSSGRLHRKNSETALYAVL